jgi:hypothetical protein
MLQQAKTMAIYAGDERLSWGKLTASPGGVGAPDEMISVSRSALFEALKAELFEFFGEIRSGAPALREYEACWIISGGIRRALAQSAKTAPKSSKAKAPPRKPKRA